jgi:hypothetical protein
VWKRENRCLIEKFGQYFVAKWMAGHIDVEKFGQYFVAKWMAGHIDA